VPTDPVFAARAETFESPFLDYAVPEAVLRFRQGFGRLIRSATDRGAVVVLDRRLLSKGYGARFLAALPPCAVERPPLRDLAGTVGRFVLQARQPSR
jgi:DNA polymerase-3 subunit epsilon/ATP-dependent DNA helicase DinG